MRLRALLALAPLRLGVFWSLLWLGCNQSICERNPAMPACAVTALQIKCPEPGGVLSLRRSNRVSLTPEPLPGETVQVWLSSGDQTVQLPATRLKIPDRGQLDLDLTVGDNSLAILRVGPAKVTVQINDAIGSSADGACALTVPVEFAPSSAALQYDAMAAPSPTQVFDLQYGGLSGTTGRLYVTELVPAMSRRLSRYVLSPDGPQLVPDASWPMVLMTAPNLGGPLSRLAANSAGLLIYDGVAANQLDLYTNTLNGANFHSAWSTTVSGIPTSGVGLAAAADLERFVIAESKRLVSLSFNLATGVKVAPISAQSLSDALGVAMRTAPPRATPAMRGLSTPEAVAWSNDTVEVLTLDPITMLLGHSDPLSTTATTALAQGPSKNFADLKLTMADLDDDGNQDLVVLYRSGEVWWAAQPVPGSFAALKTTGVTVPKPIAFTAGDLDGDGLADLAVATWDQAKGSVQVFLRK